jgi:hypothetical protein
MPQNKEGTNPPTKALIQPSKSHQRQLVDRSSPNYNDAPIQASKIPPTAVGGSFKSKLQRRTNPAPPKSHQRQLVDRSSPNYNDAPIQPPPKSHQRQLVDRSSPTYNEGTNPTSRIPPTAVGGWFKSNLQRSTNPNPQNPTNGSWWIVQVQPTTKALIQLPQSHQRQLVDRSSPTCS